MRLRENQPPFLIKLCSFDNMIMEKITNTSKIKSSAAPAKMNSAAFGRALQQCKHDGMHG